MLKIENLPDSAKFLYPYISSMHSARYDEGERLSQLGIAIVKAEINGFLMGVIHAEEISAHPEYAALKEALNAHQTNKGTK